MKVKYQDQIYRVMFNEEAEVKFKGTHQPLLWKDDSVVRLVKQENPYSGILVRYPFTGIMEEVND